jgi:anaerobic ribonucleoside-triphosphate reductase activating protein
MQAYIAGVAPAVERGNEMQASSPAIVVFFSGCNFKCPFCYNAEILSFNEEFLIDTREVKERIESEMRRGGYEAKSIILTGGEPTLQRQQLLSIARFSRQSGLFITLETNGTKPDAIKSLISDKLIDRVFLDLKSPLEPAVFEEQTKSKTFFKSSDELIKDISETIKILAARPGGVVLEARTPVDCNLLSKKGSIEAIAKEVEKLSCPWWINEVSLGAKSSEELNNRVSKIRKEFPKIKITVARQQ